MQERLHADHIDTSGAYAKRFEVIQELSQQGLLTAIPEEFKANNSVSESVPVVPVEEAEFVFADQHGERHADHTDETGRYRKAWEDKFGPLGDTSNTPTETPQQTEWKTFLQQLISEEKGKLNI
jgi:hypothetical protein